MNYRTLLPLSFAALLAVSAGAAELHVGEGQTYAKPSDAAKAAQDGDTVVIHEGKYIGDVCAWTAANLTIQGEGADKVIIDAAGNIAWGKAVWVFTKGDVKVSGVTIRKAKCNEKNGTGILLEGGFKGLCEIRECTFTKNEDGVRCGALPDCELLLEKCKFYKNGSGEGQSHNFYIGNIKKLTVRDCVSDHSNKGHALKSRAKETIVENCVFDDGDDGECAYLADFPNGGKVVVKNCKFVQSNKASNSGLVAFGMEGNLHAETSLDFQCNYLENRRENGARFVIIGKGIDDDCISVGDDENEYKGKGTDQLVD